VPIQIDDEVAWIGNANKQLVQQSVRLEVLGSKPGAGAFFAISGFFVAKKWQHSQESNLEPHTSPAKKRQQSRNRTWNRSARKANICHSTYVCFSFEMHPQVHLKESNMS